MTAPDNLRELLEMAAKAARAGGLDIIDTEAGPQVLEWTNGKAKGYAVWIPHLDDGDSRRLQVACSLTLECSSGDFVFATAYNDARDIRAYDESGDAATCARLAVLRAAAEMGRRMV